MYVQELDLGASSLLRIADKQCQTQILDLVGGVDIGADGGAGGLQDVRSAERGGGHDAAALEPGVLLQSQELQPALRIHG